MTLTFSINGTTVTLASGNVTVTMGGGNKMIIDSSVDALVLVSKFIAKFNAHTHQNSGGSGTGGVPSTALSAADVESQVVAVSS